MLDFRVLLIGAAAAFIAGLVAGFVATEMYYSPRLALCRQQSDALTAQLDEQNKGIEALLADRDKRLKEAQHAIDLAKAASREDKAAAVKIISKELPAGVSACEAARSLIAEELKK